MSQPRARSRKVSDPDRISKPDSNKTKASSGHITPKNGKTGSPSHSKTRRKSSVPDHIHLSTKLDTKKQSTTDTHTKTTHAAGSAHTNETTKSHGKTTAQSRSETHSKTTKKSEVHKSRANKKSEQDKNDPPKDNPGKVAPQKVDHEEDDNTETNDTVSTAVSQNLEDAVDEKPDENHEQS